ncbi:MAG TPA: response regulator [Candidatus Eremiobacteraeota bacterium]|nr:MAG: Alkaline phosphatase synthesis transcriptional regulatory protein PhoP [bacterium ADurb.Bin363]HPZ06797.1 response regulator [Candidatus Eremiobacteraeota bacterium]
MSDELENIIQMTKDSDPKNRQRAIRILGNTKDDRVIEPLIEALKDENNEVRRQAADALGTIGDERSVMPLIKSLQDPDDFVRGIVTWALGKIKDVRAVDHLIESLNDNDWWVRRNAAEALKLIGGEKAENALTILKKEAEKATKKILIVDDDKFILEYMQINLELDGYKVMEAFDGEEAIQKAIKEKPDLILLDIMMPKVDGWKVCKTLKENPKTKEIPIIIVSAKTQVDDFIRGMDAGAIFYIMKPFSPVQLSDAIQKALSGQS